MKRICYSHIIMVCLFLFIGRTVMAQSMNCKSMLEAYYGKMNINEKPPKGQAYYMKMSMKFIPRDTDKEQASLTNFAFYMDDHQNHYLSDQMDYFQDEKELFLVVHDQHRIYRSKSITDEHQLNKWKVLYAYRDTLIKESTVTDCNVQGNLRHMIVKLPLSRQIQSKIASMEFVLDTEKQQILSMAVNYTESHRLKRAETTYHTVDFSRKARSSAHARGNVMNGHGQLLEKYKNYQLIEKS